MLVLDPEIFVVVNGELGAVLASSVDVHNTFSPIKTQNKMVDSHLGSKKLTH